MGVGSALSCQGWRFPSLALEGSWVPGVEGAWWGTEWHKMPRGESDPRAGSEELGTWWAQEGWHL